MLETIGIESVSDPEKQVLAVSLWKQVLLDNWLWVSPEKRYIRGQLSLYLDDSHLTQIHPLSPSPSYLAHGYLFHLSGVQHVQQNTPGWLPPTTNTSPLSPSPSFLAHRSLFHLSGVHHVQRNTPGWVPVHWFAFFSFINHLSQSKSIRTLFYSFTANTICGPG